MDPDFRDDLDRYFPFEHPREGVVSAVENYWGAANGPSSFGDSDEPFLDPETGRPADGDVLTEGLGVADVRFDPFREHVMERLGTG